MVCTGSFGSGSRAAQPPIQTPIHRWYLSSFLSTLSLSLWFLCCLCSLCSLCCICLTVLTSLSLSLSLSPPLSLFPPFLSLSLSLSLSFSLSQTTRKQRRRMREKLRCMRSTMLFSTANGKGEEEAKREWSAIFFLSLCSLSALSLSFSLCLIEFISRSLSLSLSLSLYLSLSPSLSLPLSLPLSPPLCMLRLSQLLSIPFLKNYINYAKKRYRPSLSQAAAQLLIE